MRLTLSIAIGSLLAVPAAATNAAELNLNIEIPRINAAEYHRPYPELKKLPAGNYTLVVEAAREVGGRELLRVPFEWKGKPSTGSARGKTELGAVALAAKP